MSDNSVDLIIIDPPYNISIAEWDKISNYLDWIDEIVTQLFRVLKINGSLYVFGSKDFIADIKCIFSKKGFSLISWNIWNKGSKAQNSTRSYADITEHCLFFVKSKNLYLKQFGQHIKELRLKKGISLKQMGLLCDEKWFHRGGNMYFETGLAIPTPNQYFKLKEVLCITDDWDFISEDYVFNVDNIRVKRDPKEKRVFANENQLMRNVWYSNNKLETLICDHPTIKPLDILKIIVSASSNEGDIVLDCFMGSGTTAVACQQLGRNFIGFEKELTYIGFAISRLSQSTLNKQWEDNSNGND